jgi:acyl-CoA thioester hydrolase
MIRTPITPRVSETDGAGHVNNVFVPIWFEAGRREIFRIVTPDLSFRRWRVALVNMTVDYTAQLYFHAEAEVLTWIDRIGTKSFTVGEEVWQEGRLCARGTATYVYFNFDTQSSEPIPPEVVAAFERHLGKAE